jgi:hypothetical protein
MGLIYCTDFKCSVIVQFGIYKRLWWCVIIDKYADTQQLLAMHTGAYQLEKCWSEVGKLAVALEC